MEKIIALGADVGGSHITTALIDITDKQIIEGSLLRKDVSSQSSAEHIIAEWIGIFQKTLAQSAYPVQSIGIAMPGPFDYINGICLIQEQNKFNKLFGLNLKTIFAEKLGFVPGCISFTNDAESFLIGELVCGELTEYESGIGITLGTGLGSSYYKNKTASTLNYWCMPFKAGIAEDYISTKWFIERFEQLTGKAIYGVNQIITDYSDNERTKVIFTEFSENLAFILEEIILQVRPEIVIIGGNIGKAAHMYLDDVKKTLYNRLGYLIPVKVSALGETAALIGAALNSNTTINIL